MLLRQRGEGAGKLSRPKQATPEPWLTAHTILKLINIVIRVNNLTVAEVLTALPFVP